MGTGHRPAGRCCALPPPRRADGRQRQPPALLRRVRGRGMNAVLGERRVRLPARSLVARPLLARRRRAAGQPGGPPPRARVVSQTFPGPLLEPSCRRPALRARPSRRWSLASAATPPGHLLLPPPLSPQISPHLPRRAILFRGGGRGGRGGLSLQRRLPRDFFDTSWTLPRRPLSSARRRRRPRLRPCCRASLCAQRWPAAQLLPTGGMTNPECECSYAPLRSRRSCSRPVLDLS